MWCIIFPNDIVSTDYKPEDLLLTIQPTPQWELHSNQFIQRFDTTRPATIPSDGTEHKVTNEYLN